MGTSKSDVNYLVSLRSRGFGMAHETPLTSAVVYYEVCRQCPACRQRITSPGRYSEEVRVCQRLLVAYLLATSSSTCRGAVLVPEGHMRTATCERGEM
ncbi:hypothetical protein TYRP_015903 [Tyrophagus putrescentiae]|nr:hypothetical protein TYRP_015903 [Tyrophagus putrescentiae]